MPLAHSQGNQLAIEHTHGLAVLNADPARVRQVLLSILDNACKFTKHGIVSLCVYETDAGPPVEAQPADRQNGRFLVFEVRDTGIGMSPEQQQWIFEAFHQADTTRGHNYAGSGLGLAISRQLCRLMGGDITVASVPGQGSTFTVWLPAYAAADLVSIQSLA